MNGMLGLTDALIYQAGRLTTLAVIVLGVIIAFKVIREYLVSGFKAVLAAIIVGGIALWGIVAGPEFFRQQAENEADAIVNESSTNAPTITVQGG